MGGSHSSSTATATSNVINNFSQQFSANCGSTSTSSNDVVIVGSGNDISNLVQSAVSSENQTCKVYNPQSVASAATLSAAASAAATTTSQEFVGFLDDTSSDANSTITSTISNTMNQNTLFNCASNSTTANLVLVDGSGNVVQNASQIATSNVISNCLMSSSQSASVVANIAQSANATTTTTVQNFLQPFVTMLQSLMVDAGIALVAFVIFIVLIVIVYKMLLSPKTKTLLPSKTESVTTAPTPASV